MRNIKIAPGEHYHIYNRGVNKQTIFHDRSDYERFLFSILYFQSPNPVEQIGRIVKNFINVRHSVLDKIEEKIRTVRGVELVSFCLMPNHFHLIVKEIEEGGIADYMQRVLNGYTKYSNTKREKSGHVFQGPYKAVHVEDDRQLMHLSAYIHKNPNEINEWKDRIDTYPWSSYRDYIEENRWGVLVQPSIITNRFKSKKEYEHFIKTSPAKELQEELGEVVSSFDE